MSRRALGVALGIVLGFGGTAAIALALLLAGQGALFLGDSGSARTLAWALFGLASILSLVGERSLRPVLGAGERAGNDPGPRWPGWLCAGLVLLFVAVLFASYRRAPDGGWDAFSLWNARARQLLRTSGDARAACDAARSALFTLHPDYPLLLPALLAAGFRALGSRDGTWPLWLPAVVSGAAWLLAIAIISLTAARSSARRGLWLACALLTTPALLVNAGAQYAEGPLMALICAGIALLALGGEEQDAAVNRQTCLFISTMPRQTGLFSLAGFALGLAVSVKHEGMLALGAAALVLLLEDRRRLLPFALGAALPLAQAAWFNLRFAPPGDLAPNGIHALFAHVLAFRLGTILLALGRRALFFQLWAAHLVAFALLAIPLLWRGPLPAPARRLFLYCALVLAGIVLAFLTTPHELQWHLRTSIDRLLLQLWPVALFALASSQREPASAKLTSSDGMVSR